MADKTTVTEATTAKTIWTGMGNACKVSIMAFLLRHLWERQVINRLIEFGH